MRIFRDFNDLEFLFSPSLFIYLDILLYSRFHLFLSLSYYRNRCRLLLSIVSPWFENRELIVFYHLFAKSKTFLGKPFIMFTVIIYPFYQIFSNSSLKPFPFDLLNLIFFAITRITNVTHLHLIPISFIIIRLVVNLHIAWEVNYSLFVFMICI